MKKILFAIFVASVGIVSINAQKNGYKIPHTVATEATDSDTFDINIDLRNYQTEESSVEGLYKIFKNNDYDITSFNNGLIIVRNKKGKYGCIDKKGNEVIPCIYDRLEHVYKDKHYNGLFLIHGNNCLYFDIKGNKNKFTLYYDKIYDYNTYGFCEPYKGMYNDQGIAMVSKGNKICFIDTYGNEVISIVDNIYFSKNDLYSEKPSKPKLFFECNDYYIPIINNHKNTNSVVYVNSKGETYIQHFIDGYARFYKNGLNEKGQGFIDKSGKIAIPSIYDEVNEFSEGLASVKYNGKWGCIDKKGNMAIPCKYRFLRTFHEGLALARINDKYGFIDKKGNMVIDCGKYYWVDDFCNGLTTACTEGKSWYAIDRKGKENFLCPGGIYQHIWQFKDGLAVALNDELCGVINRYGKKIVPCIYNIRFCKIKSSGGLILIRLQFMSQDYYVFYDKNGNSTIDFMDEKDKKTIDAKILEKYEYFKEGELYELMRAWELFRKNMNAEMRKYGNDKI